MRQTTGQAGRLFTWALMLAFAVVPTATCVLGAETTGSRMACCAEMHDDCGVPAIERDCCVADSPNFAALRSAPPISVLAPPVLALTAVPPEPAPTASVRLACAFDSGTPKRSSSPTYLFVSVFRL